MPARLMYGGREVTVPQHADVPTDFRPGNRFSWVLQQMLDGVEPWREGEDPVETNDIIFRGTMTGFYPLVIPVGRHERRIWAVHRGHHARRPDLSPVVGRDEGDLKKTATFTIELTGTPHNPQLARAYPGEEFPPLPWMNSLKSSDWTWPDAARFWSHHAYVWRQPLIRPDTKSPTAPRWYML